MASLLVYAPRGGRSTVCMLDGRLRCLVRRELDTGFFTLMSSPARLYRLGSSRRISEIFRIGRRVRDNSAAMVALPNNLDHCRIAMAVGRKSHGNAVQRNRAKRLCREGFRRVCSQLPPGLDMVYIPRGGDWHSVDIFAESILNLARKLADKLASETPTKESRSGE